MHTLDIVEPTEEKEQEEEQELITGDGPGWIADLRKQAWRRHRELPSPKPRDERWRYTDLSMLDFGQYRFAAREAATEVAQQTDKAAARVLEGPSAGDVLHTNGTTLSSTLGREAAEAGVVFTSVTQAAATHGHVLRSRLGTLVGQDDLMGSRSLALHDQGTFLYVPPGVELELPLQSLSWSSSDGVERHVRNVVVVGEGARVVFCDHYCSAPLGSPALVAPVTEMFVGAGASVGWMTWQELGEGARYVAHLKARLERDAHLDMASVSLGGELSRVRSHVELAGRGASSQLLGVAYPRDEQAVEQWTVQDHLAPDTSSDLVYAGALSGEARSLYYGVIRVHPDAAGSDAYQSNRNLLLSPGARADSNPQLEIENDDVRCSHGAAIGPVNEQELFYLMTRGLSRQQARRLLVQGFFRRVVDRMAWSGAVERLSSALQRRVAVDA